MTSHLISDHSASPTLRTVDSGRPGRVTIGASRPWLALMAHWRGQSLDQRLAAGTPPESSQLLALRARWLVSPRPLKELARSWEEALERVQREPTPRSPRIAFCRDRMVAAASDIEQLVARLRTPCPKAVRGVALAVWILEDGTGPLYNPHCSTVLHEAMRGAISHLDL